MAIATTTPTARVVRTSAALDDARRDTGTVRTGGSGDTSPPRAE